MPSEEFSCPQCGGALAVREEGSFTTCPFCGANLHLDPDAAIGHELVLPAVAAEEAPERLGRWLKEREVTSAPLEVATRLLWFPFWTLPDGALFPAAPLLASNLSSFRLPAGDRKAFTTELTRSAEIVAATVLVEGLAVPDADRPSLRLVHVPFHEVRFRLFARDFRVWLDAASGQVLAFDLPPTSEKRLDVTYTVLLGILFCVVFWATGSIFGHGRNPVVGVVVLAAAGPLFWLATKKAMSLSEGA